LKQLRRDPWESYVDSAHRLTAAMKNRLGKP